MGKKINTEMFIIKANEAHNNKYDYSLTEYINAINKIKIICPIHGEFEQTPNKHLQKKGCSKCGFISRCKIARSNSAEFITKAICVHGTKYDYDDVMYNGKECKVNIKCVKHGIFEQTPHNHLAGNGCPICRESKGEICVKEFLIKNNITYTPQKRFNDCRNILPLPFDFYLPNYNICIEYQGIQHFKPRIKFGGEAEFKKVLLRDEIKRNYCIKNNITLIKIKYNEDIIKCLNHIL